MVWGDKIGEFNLKQGENVEVSIDLESREYNGRWYTDVKAWKVNKDDAGSFREQTGEEPDRIKTENDTDLSLDDDEIPFQAEFFQLC